MYGLKTLYFDESGQTGTNLLDSEQAYFSIGSTDLTEPEARTILHEHFPRHDGKDIKFRKLFRRSSNYSALIDFAQTISLHSKHFHCFLIDKKYAILAKMVDWLVEPYVHELGYDWYKDDYGRRWVNTFYFAFGLTASNSLLSEVTLLYDSFSRSLTSSALTSLCHRYEELALSAPEELRPFMELVATGANNFERYYLQPEFTYINDIHVTAVASSIGWWRSQYSEDFEVIHDQSTHFFHQKNLWDRMTDMSVSNGVIHVGHKTIRFPLRVRTTCPGDSAQLAPLQICDLIGGFVAKTRSPKLSDEERKVLDKMMDAGLGEIAFDSITPGYDFVDGPPSEPDGLDAVDQVTRLVFSKREL